MEKLNGREAQIGGTPAYVMEVIVHVTLLKDHKSFDVLQFFRANWLAQIGGKTGESRKTGPIELIWMKTDNGWGFVSPS